MVAQNNKLISVINKDVKILYKVVGNKILSFNKIIHYVLVGFRKRKTVSTLRTELVNFSCQSNKGEIYMCQSLFKRHLIKFMIYS